MSNDTPAQAAKERLHLSVQRIYLKDTSLEARDLVAAFLGNDALPEKATFEYNVNTTKRSDHDYEVVLNTKLAIASEQGDALTVEVSQAGIFTIMNITDPTRINRILHVRCPRILLPYAREAISNLTAKSGIPPFTIGPLDFRASYAQMSAGAGQDQATAQ